jgi:uncharacterized protein DUF4288
MKQKWYIATLIIRSRVGDEPGPYTCDEQIRVIRAFNADAAYEKAVQISTGEEQTYENSDGENVFWEFVGLEDLEELDSAIRDGTDIRSRLFGHPNPESLVSLRERLQIFQTATNAPPRKNRIIVENISAEDD